MGGLLHIRDDAGKPTRFVRPNLSHRHLKDAAFVWPILEGTGLTVRNVVANTNHGVLTGSNIGWNGRDVEATADSNYIDVGDTGASITPICSLVHLYYPTTSAQYAGLLFNRAADVWGTSYGASGDIVLTWHSSNWNTSTGISNVEDTWNFLVVTRDGSSTVTWYHWANGIYTKTTPGGYDTTASQAIDDLNIGLDDSNSARTMQGRFRYVALYNRTLPEREVHEMYVNLWAPFARRVWVPAAAAAAPAGRVMSSLVGAGGLAGEGGIAGKGGGLAA